MSRNPYFYDDAPVLINRLGIKDQKLLDETESTVTNLRAAELFRFPLTGEFDLAHMQAIHKALFGDLYKWAGEIRISLIRKSTPDRMFRTTFAHPEEIRDVLSESSKYIKKSNYFRDMDVDEFRTAILDTHVKLNFAHPFPEGNGRTTQTMLRQLSWDSGFYLDYSRVNKDEWAIANAFALPHVRLYEHGAVQIPQEPNLDTLSRLFAKIIRRREEVEPGHSPGWFIR